MERERNQEGQSSDSSTTKAVIVGTGIVCGVVGAVLGAFGYHLWKKEEEMQKQMHSHTGSGKVYNKGSCPICLEEMHELTVLPCGHQYHATCTKQLRDVDARARCPVCRKNIKD
ncbi:RING finger protein 122-like [Periplaneta americana]|uniref:RING finger protein 122-like n=1 Tax=Periplaneta americana TaxID=6978 RepID=UPI0037E7325C